MVTTEVRGSLPDALRIARSLSSALGREHAVVRTKIETDRGWTSGALYLEHHVRVPDSGSCATAAVDVCRAHGARLASNARNGARFATMRHFGVAMGDSSARADAFVAALEANGIAVTRDIISEACIYDDNPARDRGWRIP